MKIAIVNDSIMAVESLRRVLAAEPDYEIAWVAYNGVEAVTRCAEHVPDLILMDLIMPVMDGVEATRIIMEETPCAIVVVTATVSGHAPQVFSAMGFGALDAVNTPVLGLTGDAEGKDELLVKIATVDKLVEQRKPEQAGDNTIAPLQRCRSRDNLVAIGSSSGGPAALAMVLAGLPADFATPIVIVQHVDVAFAAELAGWLNNQCAFDVAVACNGVGLESGKVWVAGTNNHLVLNQDKKLVYTEDAIGQSYTPSVDVFFQSLARHWTGDLVAALLTGMGRDGAQGLLELRTKGYYTIAQDEGSCAVYGMPKAAARLNAAVEILSIGKIAPALSHYFHNTNNNGRRLL